MMTCPMLTLLWCHPAWATGSMGTSTQSQHPGPSSTCSAPQWKDPQQLGRRAANNPHTTTTKTHPPPQEGNPSSHSLQHNPLQCPLFLTPNNGWMTLSLSTKLNAACPMPLSSWALVCTGGRDEDTVLANAREYHTDKINQVVISLTAVEASDVFKLLNNTNMFLQGQLWWIYGTLKYDAN